MSKNEKFDLPISETETEEIQEEKEKVSFLSSRKGRIILAASVSGVLLLAFLIFQIVRNLEKKPTSTYKLASASELQVLSGITRKFGLAQLSKDTTIEEAEWFKSIQRLGDVEHAHARILSKVVQRNSFPINKGIIVNHCLNYLLTQAKIDTSSFYGGVLSVFEPLLMKIMVENKMYKEIVDLAIEHNEKLMELMRVHFKTEDYAKFVNVLKTSVEKRATLIEKMKKSSNSLAKTAIYSHLLIQGFQKEFPWLDIDLAIDVFDYLVFNTDKQIFKDESFIDYFIGKVNSDLIVMNLLESIRPSSSQERTFDHLLFAFKVSGWKGRIISAYAAFGKLETLNQFFTPKLFEQSIVFLKQFSLENITIPVLSLFEKDKISGGPGLKSFLFENFPVSKVEISLSDSSNNVKIVATFEIEINQGELKELEIELSYKMDGAVEIISDATFKDSKVLIDIFEKLHQLGFKFKSSVLDALPIRFESLLMFIDSKKLRELAAKLNLTFNQILSYNSITKQFDEKYLPYELISHPKVEKLEGVYKPSSIDISELLVYNENDDNFKIFSILSPSSFKDLVLDSFSETNTGLVFDLQRYSICLNALIYLMNSEQGAIKTLHPVVKDFLRKDFPELTNVLDGE